MVKAKERVTLIAAGPQGCGKSTMLRVVAASLVAAGYTVSWRDQDGHTIDAYPCDPHHPAFKKDEPDGNA